jgi:uncharacterized protein (TIGR02217 family)
MSDFIESPRFPELISFHALAGPEFQTDVVVVQSGAEARNQNWEQARRRYEVSHAVRLPAQYIPLKAFFHVVGGRAIGFRFKDWTDFECADAEGKFLQLTSTTFQLLKRYTSGSETYDRVISKPISAISITGGSSPVVDYTTGIVTVSSGTPTAWNGEFDVPCRFDTDRMEGEIIDKAGTEFIIGWNSIPIVEIRI